jgi:hypothetical protein
MRIFLDIDSRRVVTIVTRNTPVLEFKRRDNDVFEVQFLRSGVAQVFPVGTVVRVGVKAKDDFTGEFLATNTLSAFGTGSETFYSGELNFNTTALETLFSAEPASASAMLEVEWVLGFSVGSSLTIPIIIHNDVIRGDEGEPANLPLFYTSGTSDFLATQAEAEAGSDNTKWMSPLRVAQAIEELGGGGGVSSWNDLTDKPSTFPPSTHQHTIADTTGLQTALDAKAATSHTHPLSALTQSSATNGQVVTWDGTAWVPQDPAGGVTSYNDLTDVPGTFAPKVHTHAIADVTDLQAALDGKAASTHTHAISDTTGLQTALDGKQESGSYAPATGIAQSAVTNLTTDLAGKASSSHTHAATDITSGTLAIALIPTGTTSTTVALGNHSHTFGTTSGTYCQGNDSRLSDARTPTTHTHGNLTNTGAIGTTSGVPIIAGAGGVLQAGAFGTNAGTFCQGNDSRLLNLSGGITAIAVVATMPASPNATTLYIVTT